MDKLLTLATLALDLHRQAGGANVDQVARLKAWLPSPAGRKIIADLDQLLAELGIPLSIVVKK